MRTQNGHCLGEEVSTQSTAVDTRHLSKSQLEFLDFVKFHGIDEFITSLKMIHDFALYHTDLCFDTSEKNALFNLKILWESLELIGQES